MKSSLMLQTSNRQKMSIKRSKTKGKIDFTAFPAEVQREVAITRDILHPWGWEILVANVRAVLIKERRNIVHRRSRSPSFDGFNLSPC